MPQKLDLTQFDYALKELYKNKVVQDMAFRDKPGLDLLPKADDFYGDQAIVPVVYGHPNNSVTFATAQTNRSTSSGVKFTVTRAKRYGVIELDHETILAASRNVGSFLEAKSLEINNVLDSVMRSTSLNFYRGNGGAIAQAAASSAISTTSLTLADASMASAFHVGQVVQMDSVDGGGTVHSGTATIAGVDQDSGVLTASANWTAGISSASDGDYIFNAGDYDGGAHGLNNWVPVSVTATTHFGINRTVDPTKLAGQRLTGTGMPIEEALRRLAVRICREGGKPDICLVHHDRWADLEESLDTKVIRDAAVGKTGTGYEAIVIRSPKGPVKVIADQDCPYDTAFMLTSSSWKLWSLEAYPQVFMYDGNRGLRMASADSLEIRVGGFFQFVCNAPGWNGRTSLDT